MATWRRVKGLWSCQENWKVKTVIWYRALLAGSLNKEAYVKKAVNFVLVLLCLGAPGLLADRYNRNWCVRGKCKMCCKVWDGQLHNHSAGRKGKCFGDFKENNFPVIILGWAVRKQQEKYEERKLSMRLYTELQKLEYSEGRVIDKVCLWLVFWPYSNCYG